MDKEGRKKKGEGGKELRVFPMRGIEGTACVSRMRDSSSPEVSCHEKINSKVLRGEHQEMENRKEFQ